MEEKLLELLPWRTIEDVHAEFGMGMTQVRVVVELDEHASEIEGLMPEKESYQMMYVERDEAAISLLSSSEPVMWACLQTHKIDTVEQYIRERCEIYTASRCSVQREKPWQIGVNLVRLVEYMHGLADANDSDSEEGNSSFEYSAAKVCMDALLECFHTGVRVIQLEDPAVPVIGNDGVQAVQDGVSALSLE